MGHPASRSRLQRLAAAVLLGAALLLPAAARAADPDPVKALLAQARQLRLAQRDQEAVELLRRALQLQPSPRVKAELGAAEQAVGRFVEAEELIQQALAAGDDPWIARYRPVLTAALESMAGRLARLEVLGDRPGALVLIDGRARAQLPMRRPVRVVAGSLTLEVRARDGDAGAAAHRRRPATVAGAAGGDLAARDRRALLDAGPHRRLEPAGDQRRPAGDGPGLGSDPRAERQRL
jgi:tetratricopeptide (TPR) repeat protein